jgi:putative tryptophan/tyrosine transport system substrate-binding protein
MHPRRKLLAAMALAALAPAVAAQGRKVTVAMLMTANSADDAAAAARFISAMRAHGWAAGENIVYEQYSAGGSRAQASEVARAVAKSKPDLIYAPTGGAATAALHATNDIPVVFITVNDPVAGGYIASLSRPGGNATGVVQMGADVVSKRLELVREALPRASRVGVLLDTRAIDYAFQKRQFEEALKPRGMAVLTEDISSFQDVPAALARLKKRGAHVLTSMPSFTLVSRRRDLIVLAAQLELPIVSYRSEWAEAGALLTYGADQAEVYRRSADIATRLLRGARAADTPVDRVTKFELIVNLQAAKKLKIEVPQSLLLRADRVIQ